MKPSPTPQIVVAKYPFGWGPKASPMPRSRSVLRLLIEGQRQERATRLQDRAQ
jgi:hypothetical protein